MNRNYYSRPVLIATASLIATTSLMATVMALARSDWGHASAGPPARELAAPTQTITARQAQWLRASPNERVRMTERLGEEGAEAFASKQGYTPLLRSGDKLLRQGLDQVYHGKNGDIIVIEAKGGTGAVSVAYGCQQGTPEWAVHAAKRVAASSKASAAEKRAARIVLAAAKERKLTVQVVRTPHICGEPLRPALESSLRAGPAESKRAAKLLGELEARLLRPRIVTAGSLPKELGALADISATEVASALTEASEHIRAPGQLRWVKAGGKMFKFVGRVAGPAGIVIAASLYTADAAEIEKRLERGELTIEQADAEQAKLAVRTGVGASAGFVGMEVGAVIGSFVCPTVIGGMVGAVGGFVGAELVMAATGLSETLGEYLRPGVECVRQACGFVKENGVALTLAARELGNEAYDQIKASLGSAAIWVGEMSRHAGMAVNEAVVVVKDKTVKVASVVGSAVGDGATWSWHQMQCGWGYLRSQFE